MTRPSTGRGSRPRPRRTSTAPYGISHRPRKFRPRGRAPCPRAPTEPEIASSRARARSLSLPRPPPRSPAHPLTHSPAHPLTRPLTHFAPFHSTHTYPPNRPPYPGRLLVHTQGWDVRPICDGRHLSRRRLHHFHAKPREADRLVQLPAHGLQWRGHLRLRRRGLGLGTVYSTSV